MLVQAAAKTHNIRQAGGQNREGTLTLHPFDVGDLVPGEIRCQIIAEFGESDEPTNRSDDDAKHKKTSVLVKLQEALGVWTELPVSTEKDHDYLYPSSPGYM